MPVQVFITNKDSFDTMLEMRGISDNNVETWDKTAFISINDPSGTDEKPYFSHDHKNVKVIFFHDIEEDIQHSKYGLLKAFDITQARELCTFIRNQSDRQNFIVHCAAGISRSGAVGSFINDYFKGDHLEFKRKNPYIHPNGLVTRLLKTAMAEMQD